MPEKKTEKKCSRCKNTFPLVCFWGDATRPDGKSQRCKNCDSIKNAKYWSLYYPANRVRLIRNVLDRRKSAA